MWPHCNFICISLMAKDAECFSYSCCPFVLLLRRICSIHLPILIRLRWYFGVKILSSLYVLNINPAGRAADKSSPTTQVVFTLCWSFPFPSRSLFIDSTPFVDSYYFLSHWSPIQDFIACACILKCFLYVFFYQFQRFWSHV